MLRFIFLLAALSLPVGGLLAQGGLEVIQLRHRTAEQILPQIKPFVEAGGAVTGMNDRLFLRASAANRAQVRQMVEALDRPQRRLVITVSRDNQQIAAGAGVEVGGSAGRGSIRIESGTLPAPAGEAGRWNAKTYSTRGRAADRATQQVQVVEGGKAFISTGVSVPLPLRQMIAGPGGVVVSEAVVYRDLSSGFYAEPHVSGTVVTVDISPVQETLDPAAGASVRHSRLFTTVSGRLGEWIALGAVGEEASMDAGSAGRYSTRGSLDSRSIWLKVEELP